MLKKTFFLKSAIIVTIATLFSKILGLVRQQYGLYFFGGGWEYDAFVAAFRIPNALRELLAEGALSSAFIPLFASILVKYGKDKAFAFANKILALSLVLSFVVVILGIASSSFFMQYYHNNPSALGSTELAIDLFSILMIYLPFISLSAILMGMLNSLDVFFIPSLGPFVSNLFFLLILFTFYSIYGIHTLAYALIIGGIAYLFMLVPFVYKKGFRIRPSFAFKDSYIRDFVRLFIPFALALGIPKLNNILSNIYSDAITGANTALSQGFFMIQLPISLFVVSVSMVSLPTMSKYYESNEMDELKRIILLGLRMVFMFTLPATIGFMMLNREIVSLVYSDIIMFISNGDRGAINDLVLNNISLAQYYFAPSIITIGFSVILIRAFQSIRNMWSLIYSSSLSVCLHLALMSIFLEIFKLPFYFIAMSISISSFFSLALLFILLSWKIEGFKIDKRSLVSLLKIVLSSILMGLVIYLLKDIDFISLFALPYINNIVRTCFIILSASLLYFLFLYLLGEEGFNFFIKSLYKRVFRIRS